MMTEHCSSWLHRWYASALLPYLMPLDVDLALYCNSIIIIHIFAYLTQSIC